MAERPLGARVRRFVDDGRPQRSSTPVFWLTLATLIIIPVLSESEWGRLASMATLGSATVVALSRSGAHGFAKRLGLGIVVLAAIVSVVTPTLDSTETGSALEILSAAMVTLLLFVTPVLVMARRLLNPRITLDTVMATLTTYLQIGLFFGALYRLIDLASSSPFFAQTDEPGLFDFTYFSFITMTTVGYGDYSAAGNLGRSLAMVEAVTGQIFLVVVVALVVSNLGREVPRRTGGADDTARLPPAD
jgi:voltage-gated potassium channel Kch